MPSLHPHRKNNLLKVVILGDGGVGKSCLMNRFVTNNFDSHSFHTVGVEFSNKDIDVNGDSYTLQLWDTAGQERFKSLRTPFYRGTDICMLTYAINDETSFKNLSMWRDEFLYYSGIKDAKQYPFLVVGSKVDLGDEMRKVDSAIVKGWCDENGNIPIVETSAKDAINVNLAFSLAVQRWIDFEELLEKSNDFCSNTINLKSEHTKKNFKFSCCS